VCIIKYLSYYSHSICTLASHLTSFVTKLYVNTSPVDTAMQMVSVSGMYCTPTNRAPGLTCPESMIGTMGQNSYMERTMRDGMKHEYTVNAKIHVKCPPFRVCLALSPVDRLKRPFRSTVQTIPVSTSTVRHLGPFNRPQHGRQIPSINSKFLILARS